ncbi:hypothetical protein PLICRDRAFT_58426 [Plicaturopsis crispa FD-325 SS-3]|uniref:Uncharacterized protein n=1 Tax=Plicaturopsis crispa FD-325 SS-3 TaxID=944288 RepID=A0A0C9SQ54_PLICR|nr:hypothetical protein PLICRDRAFT_58426 [Plicaturopsis crispa FD-325 SS-3]
MAASKGLPMPWIDNPTPTSKIQPGIQVRLKTAKIPTDDPCLDFDTITNEFFKIYRPFSPDNSIIHFFEFRGQGPPPSDVGYPGDVYFDLKPDQKHRLYRRNCQRWEYPADTTPGQFIWHPYLARTVLGVCPERGATWVPVDSEWSAVPASGTEHDLIRNMVERQRMSAMKRQIGDSETRSANDTSKRQRLYQSNISGSSDGSQITKTSQLAQYVALLSDHISRATDVTVETSQTQTRIASEPAWEPHLRCLELKMKEVLESATSARSERDRAVRERDELARERDETARELNQAARERDRATFERGQVTRERDSFDRQQTNTRRKYDALERMYADLECRFIKVERERDAAESERAEAEQQHDRTRARLKDAREQVISSRKENLRLSRLLAAKEADCEASERKCSEFIDAIRGFTG